MAKVRYSREICDSLIEKIRGLGIRLRYPATRYEPGTELVLTLKTAWPERTCTGTFRVEKFAGGGFAGQVYRSRLVALTSAADLSDTGLEEKGVYAVKVLVPPSRFAAGFRNWVYGLAFQAPFSAQVVEPACRAGLLWPKVLRLAAKEHFGSADAIADTYASFYDAEFGAFGEVREWVEGRTWRLESDLNPSLRRAWRTVDPAATQSPEYVAKRQFMFKLTSMMRAMGARELARQYVWSTYKSQPNVLKRFGHDADPAGGLCAVDFRAGLALLPYLPMSPGDFGLIADGIRHGSWTQFDRSDFGMLDQYVAQHSTAFAGQEGLLSALKGYDRQYRRAMPDLFHQGVELIGDAELRREVREGLVGSYRAANWIDADFAPLLLRSTWRFALFYVLGAIPIAGAAIRSLWGNRSVREHLGLMLKSFAYLRKSGVASAAAAVIEWHRCGRVGERHALLLANHVSLFWLERLTVRLLWPFLHRAITEPLWLLGMLRERIRYIRLFLQDAAFRSNWLREQVKCGLREGMLQEAEAQRILANVDDPFIARYLKSIGVHLAILPVTQIVSLGIGVVVAAHVYARTGDATRSATAFAGVLVFFQLFPISPGSICRGVYVVWLMIRDRNFRDYVVAAPLSFVKYIGYLAFPIQMAATYPALSQFMAGRWATGAVHIIPVFGEQGAVLEHTVFDWFYNRPRIWGRWLRCRIRGVLTLWMLLSILLGGLGLYRIDPAGEHATRQIVNVLLAVLCVGILPRCLFYPLLRGPATK